jgi:multidrug efflux pump subunit AcrB
VTTPASHPAPPPPPGGPQDSAGALAKFFIERPVFAVVISLVIVFAGLAAVFALPVAQYPEITPPTVQVTCSFPGADARVLQETVAAPIEQQVNGVENMLYMSSQSANDGNYTLTVTFKLGTNLDMAQVLVQNRVSLALPSLPDVVKATGVSVKKKSPSILLVVNLYANENPDTKQPYFDQLYISNYATIQIKDELARLEGVGDVSFLGQQDYSMRVWLEPTKMSARNLTSSDVVAALREQNVQVAAGQLGQPPTPPGQDFQYTLTTVGRLREPEQFGEIVVKTGEVGQVTLLRDIARIERSAKREDVLCFLDGKPSVGLALYQLPGSNALATADLIRAKMRELAKSFPKGLEYAIVYDTTPFIEESVLEVFKTLRDAVILVAIVVLFFLQDWKAMILPMIDVPVSLIGTFAVMAMMGFTLNNLTLFGLVLAIGIVVDDAIVVLENVEVWLARGYDAKTATIKAMSEITGPIIAITLVLCSVFLPSAFITGISGQFYRQFALTIATSMMISAANAMTMTPSRAALIFKDHTHGGEDKREALPWWGWGAVFGWVSYALLTRFFGAQLGLPVESGHGGHEAAEQAHAMSPWLLWAIRAGLFIPGFIVGWLLAKPINRVLRVVFKAFNRFFDGVTAVYGWLVARLLRLAVIVLVVYGGLIFLTLVGFTRTPTGFIPSQDKGYLLVNIQLPDSASLERTRDAVQRAAAIAAQAKGVRHTIGVPGQSFILNANSSNFGSMFVILDSFHDRHGIELYADTIARKLRQQFNTEILEAQFAVFGAPAVDGLGNAGGFKLMIQDRAAGGLDLLAAQADNIAAKASQIPGIAGVFSSFRNDTPQMYVDINRTQAKTMGVPLSEIFNALQANLGSLYVNDFNAFGRTWQVIVQADAAFRLKPDDVRQLKVRNLLGEMVPLGSVADVRDSTGPVMITRYNMYAASALNGASYPGMSSGDVIRVMEELCSRELARGMGYEWTELTFLQTQEGSSAIYAFVGAVILVFLVLAAQYESWSMPLAVILVVPMCLLSALIGVVLAKMDINIFVQVGLLVLVGLASKNAILIVEFAREQRRQGKSTFDAAVDASKARLRPIVMTSFAFILGVLPLVVSAGAGAEMRRTLGVAVFAGMLGVTLFGIFLTPVFYYVIEWFGRPKSA